MKSNNPRLIIPEWDGLTDYRPFIFEQYKFEIDGDPKSKKTIRMAALEYAGNIEGPCNSKWVERRKITDAFKMGIEYAKRHLLLSDSLPAGTISRDEYDNAINEIRDLEEYIRDLQRGTEH